MLRITVLLRRVTQTRCFSTYTTRPFSRYIPVKKGNSVSNVIFNKSGPKGADCPVLRINQCTNRGVRKTPKMFDNAALKSAAAVFPCAIAVRTTEVEMVEGSTQR